MRIANHFAFLCGCAGLCVAAQPLLAQNTTAIPVPRALSPTMINQVPVPVNPAILNPNIHTLVFDADTKQYDAKPGEKIAPFTFSLTNVGASEIVITQVKPSCGCTTAKIPPTPWHIPPGGTGSVEAQVNLAGKMGLVTKSLKFSTSVGEYTLWLKVNIQPPDPTLDRKAAMAKAAVDSQAIFKGDCMSCHVNKGVNTFGQDLYAADCGICHESSHRDSAVPDLHALKQPTNLEYWKTMITFGKPHSMMPGFARAQGGPLTDEQIASLAKYLNRTISHNFSSPQMTNAAVAPRSLLGSGIYNSE